MAKICCGDIVLMNFVWGKRRWRKDKIGRENDQTWVFILQKMPFSDIYWKKFSKFHFFGAQSFLLIHIRLTPSEGLKSFVNLSSKGNWTMKSDYGISSVVQLHGPCCKPALSVGHIDVVCWREWLPNFWCYICSWMNTQPLTFISWCTCKVLVSHLRGD
jgi:hypothetical protein